MKEEPALRPHLRPAPGRQGRRLRRRDQQARAHRGSRVMAHRRNGHGRTCLTDKDGARRLPDATTSRPERPQMRDNSYRARQDGDEYSSLPGEPRRTSLFLAAQMHPLATARCCRIAAAVTALLLPRGASACRPRPRAPPPARRYETVTRRSGNGHDRKVTGPLSAAPGRLRGPRAAAALTRRRSGGTGPEAS